LSPTFPNLLNKCPDIQQAGLAGVQVRPAIETLVSKRYEVVEISS